MKKEVIIYHGSISIIEKPIFGYGKPYNDYGMGFYCTESLELAKEWAVSEGKNGYANKYKLDLTGLKILNLSKDANTLNWITILIQNRKFLLKTDIAKDGEKYLLEHYNLNYRDYDVIIGYRADDSYFNYANSFLNNTITLGRLEEAMRLGNLGEQIVLISKKAFNQLQFLGYEKADSDIYYPMRMERNTKAQEQYLKKRREKPVKGDKYLSSIIEEEE